MAYLKDHNASISLRIFIFREEGNLTFGDESFAVQKGTIKFFIKVGFTEFHRIQHEKIFFHRHVLGSFEKRKKKQVKVTWRGKEWTFNVGLCQIYFFQLWPQITKIIWSSWIDNKLLIIFLVISIRDFGLRIC